MLFTDLPKDREQHIQLKCRKLAIGRWGLLPPVLNSEVTAFLNQTIEKVAVENGRISYSAPFGANVDQTRVNWLRFPLKSYKVHCFQIGLP